MYAMTTTQPDIPYGIGVLIWSNHNPSNEPMVALKRVFRYLASTKDWQLHFGGALGQALARALGESTLRGAGEQEGALGRYVDMDYAGCPDDYKSTRGLFITFVGVVNWRSRTQKSTALFTTVAQYYAFGVGCMRLTQISHVLNKLGIPTISQVFSNSQSPIAIIKNRIYRGTALAHIVTKYHVAADMTRNEEIDLSYIQTAKMLTDWFTKPLPKHTCPKRCAVMRIIGIALRNALGTFGNGLGNGYGYFIGIGNRTGIENAFGKQID